MGTKRFRYDIIPLWSLIITVVLIVVGFLISPTFRKIISIPDNVPIAIMLLVVEYFTWLAFKQADRSDEYTRQGQREKIYEDMIR